MRGKAQEESFISSISSTLTHDIIERAFEEERIEDFEDALQFHSAKTSVKIFITRNKRHFEAVKDEMEFLTPEEFLKKVQVLIDVHFSIEHHLLLKLIVPVVVHKITT